MSSESTLQGQMSSTEEYIYEHAAVAADSAESSQIGTSIMRDQGGSAVDGAIAAVLCSGVVNAHSCGIGGGAIMTYYQRSTGKVYTINGREHAPSGIHVDMFTDDTLKAKVGGLSICIPGEIKCLYEAWKLGGRLPWKQLFQPTIDLCRNGVRVRKAMADAMDLLIRNDSLHLRERVPGFIDFLTNPKTGNVYKEGDVMYRPRLARTLEIIANEGPESFYNGSLSEEIKSDVMEANGLVTRDDLANYTAPVKPPFSMKLSEELTLYSPPLPSSGIVCQFILNILKGFNFDETSISTTDEAVTTWHRITEAFKHATTLKHRLGDNDVGTQDYKACIDETLRKMSDDKFAESRRLHIVDTETFDLAYYDPVSIDINTNSHGTSHLSALGPEGDAVAVTNTVSCYFGSKVVGNRTGIVFNDVMRNFSLPNTTSRYNRPPSEENILEALKRPISSMCPSIVVDKAGDVKLVIGASGANKIPTAIALELIDGLKRIGHEVTDINSFSVVQGILRSGNKITAYSDPRKEGKPDGY